jgi:hypothetical protein
MSDYDWNEIETALASTEDRWLLPERDRPVRSPEQTTILQNYRDRLGAGLAAADGSDLDQLREEYKTEGRRFNEAEKERAIERSSDRLAMLQSSIAASRGATEDIMSRRNQAADSELRRDWIVLDVARSIRLKARTVIDQRTGRGPVLAPWDNKVKVESAWSSIGDHLGLPTGGVGFVFLWTNPNSYSVVLDVESWVALNGFCTVGADGSFFGDSSTHLNVTTSLQPSLPSDPIYPPIQQTQNVTAEEVSADGGLLGEIRSQSVAGYYGMYYHNFIVPGGQVAAFEVAALFNPEGPGDGSARADFLSGDFHVLCPMVAIAIV